MGGEHCLGGKDQKESQEKEGRLFYTTYVLEDSDTSPSGYVLPTYHYISHYLSDLVITLVI